MNQINTKSFIWDYEGINLVIGEHLCCVNYYQEEWVIKSCSKSESNNFRTKNSNIYSNCSKRSPHMKIQHPIQQEVTPMKHLHRHKHNTQALTSPVIMWENELVECNQMYWYVSVLQRVQLINKPAWAESYKIIKQYIWCRNDIWMKRHSLSA